MACQIRAGAERDLTVTDRPARATMRGTHGAVGLPDVIVCAACDVSAALPTAIVPEQTALKYWGVPGGGANLIVAAKPGSAAVVASQLPAAILPTDPARLAVVSSTTPFILQSVINGDISKLLLLGVLGITGVTLTSVLERIYEIGVRRALGATRRAIVAQFLAESTILGASGGVAGTCAAVIVLVLISQANGWLRGPQPAHRDPRPANRGSRRMHRRCLSRAPRGDARSG